MTTEENKNSNETLGRRARARTSQDRRSTESISEDRIQDMSKSNTPVDTTSFLKKALALKIDPVESFKQPNLDQKELDTLVDVVNDRFNCNDPGLAYTGICATLQAGGTNANKRSNVKIRIQEILFESKIINDLIRKHTKLSPRQLARILCDDIFAISKQHNITGNAFTYITRFHSQYLLEIPDRDERFWAADFQIDNPKCDENVKKALQARYADKFGTKKRK